MTWCAPRRGCQTFNSAWSVMSGSHTLTLQFWKPRQPRRGIWSPSCVKWRRTCALAAECRSTEWQPLNIWRFVFTTCDQEAKFMSTPAAERAHKHIENCLHHYLWMHESAWVHNKWYCLPVPKVHYSWHLGYSARFMNPRFCWTYKAESWVGKLSHIASSCAFGVKSARLTVPFSEKYRYFVHVRLARQVLE